MRIDRRSDAVSGVPPDGPCAQTHLQLYRQLLRRGWPEPELAAVAGAYGLALELFTARYRADGRPFLAHLVGTASIVAALDGAPTLVCAALLHACFEQGRFGDGARGVTPSRFAELERRQGTAVASLVATYTRFPWNVSAVRALHERRGRLTAEEQDVVLLRLANELEEHLELGQAWSDKGRGQDAEARERHRQRLCALAEAIDRPELSQALTMAWEEEATAVLPACLVSSRRGSWDRFPRTEPFHRRIRRWLRGGR